MTQGLSEKGTKIRQWNPSVPPLISLSYRLSQHFLILTHDPASSFAIITNKMKTIAMPCIMLPLFGNLILHHKNELMISFPFFSTFISCKPVIVTSPLERSLMGISTTISDGETMVTVRQEQKLN